MSAGRLCLYTCRNYHGTLYGAIHSPKIEEAPVQIANSCKEGQCNNEVEEEQVKMIINSFWK